MKIYILEDEINVYNYILSLLKSIPEVSVVGNSGSIEKAKLEIPSLKPDLVIADIQLTDGISFTLFNQIEINFQLFFISAFNQYALDALNLGALAYLLKPIDNQKFNEVIFKCSKNIDSQKIQKLQIEIASLKYNSNTKPTRIALNSTDFTQIVQISDIKYCQSDSGYTTFFMKDGNKILVSKGLKEYENVLANSSFVRCHQSFLVNLETVNKYYKDGYLELNTKERIPVSERKKQFVKENIEEYLK